MEMFTWLNSESFLFSNFWDNSPDRVLSHTTERNSAKVEKSWLQENDINKSSIVLYKYDSENKEWIELIPTITCEDDKSVYFTTKVPGYSSFVIGGKDVSTTQLTEDSVCDKPIGEIKCNGNNNGEIRSTGNGTVTKGTPKSSGFGLISEIICLFCMFLYRDKGR